MLMMSGISSAWWRWVPSACTAPPNKPHCTPTFTISERSAKAIISMEATEAPRSPPPPYSTGKPSAVWPVFAKSLASPVIRVLAVSMSSPYTGAHLVPDSWTRAPWRTCAQRPSSTSWMAPGST